MRHSLPFATAGHIALIFALLHVPVSIARGAQSDDTELKATFIMNFLRMVRWNASASEVDVSTLGVCALSNSELFGLVRAAGRGKGVGDRTINVIVTPDPEPAACRVVIFEASQYGRAPAVLKRFDHAPVLTIGNGPGFLKAGGMFELVIDDGRLQFNACLEAIRRSGLEVSARLLRLARSLQPRTVDGS
jgi:hypothetical protein